MFRTRSTKKGKQRSILDRQNVNQKSSSQRPFWSRFSMWLKVAVVSSFAVVIWQLASRATNRLVGVLQYFDSAIVLTPGEWRLEVLSRDEFPLPEDVKREIYKIAQNYLHTGSPPELDAIGRKVELLGMLDGIRIVRPRSDTVIVSASVRRPVLLVSVGTKSRFLTVDGTVYGDAADNLGNVSTVQPSLMVTGIFDSHSAPHVDGTMRVITTAEEQEHLSEAIEIWQKTMDSGLDVKVINFQKFRGFAVRLGNDTEIIVGLKPFDYKLKKLRGIVDGLKRDGIVASRIELDYDGKAFIKERKL